MKNNDDIPTTDTTEIKQLINRVKRGELDQEEERRWRVRRLIPQTRQTIEAE